MDFGKIFSKAFYYSFSFNRVLPFFIVNVIMISSILYFLDYLIDIIPLISAGYMSAMGIVSTSILFILIYIALAMVNLFISGAVTDNARLSWEKKEKSITASFGIAKKKYLSILGASLIAAIISSLVTVIPYIGWLAAIVVSWIFLFIIPSIIVSNKKAVDALRDSYEIFIKQKFNVFLFWLLLVIIVLAVFTVFVIIPVILLAMPVLTQMIPATVDNTAISDSEIFMDFLRENIGIFYIAGIFIAAVLAYLSVLQDSAKAFFYMSVKKTSKKK